MKRTPKNCTFAKKMIRKFVGEPEVDSEGCHGYGDKNENPLPICESCKCFFCKDEDV